jgi:hypothetical protein
MDLTGKQSPGGWYPDPQGAGYRYWDGAQWTDHYRAPEVTPEEPQEPGHLAASSSPSRGVFFSCGIFGILAGAAALVVALSIPLEPTDLVVATETYIKPAYYAVLVIGGAEVIVVAVALAVTAIFRPWSTVIPDLFAVTFTLGILMLAGAGAALLGFQTAEIGGSPPPAETGEIAAPPAE